MQPFMSISDKNRSTSQQVRDEQEAKDRRAAQAAMDRRGNIESARQQEEQTRAAKQRRETQLKNITAQDLASMSPADIAKAYDEGLLEHLSAPAPATADSDHQADQDNQAGDAQQPAAVTREELAAMSLEEILQAYDDGRFTAQPATEPAGPVTEEELASMTPAEIVKAYDAGRFNAQQND